MGSEQRMLGFRSTIGLLFLGLSSVVNATSDHEYLENSELSKAQIEAQKKLTIDQAQVLSNYGGYVRTMVNNGNSRMSTGGVYEVLQKTFFAGLGKSGHVGPDETLKVLSLDRKIGGHYPITQLSLFVEGEQVQVRRNAGNGDEWYRATILG